MKIQNIYINRKHAANTETMHKQIQQVLQGRVAENPQI